MDPSPASSDSYSAADGPRENERYKLENFRNTLLQQTRWPVVTFLIVLANVLVFLWMVLKGVSPFQPTAFEIIAWGANYAPRTLDGEEWRFFTCMFLHIGVLHLGMNMLALWNLGRILERLVGPVGFFLLYFVSGLAGSLASVSWNAMNPSAGASGAIFGVAGALLGVSWKCRRSLPQVFLKSARFLAFNVLVLFVVFTVINQFHPMIDNSAHLAGVLTGAICGLVLGEPIPNIGRSHRLLRNRILAVAGTAGLYLAFALLPGPPTDVVKLEQKYLRVSETVYDKLDQANGRLESEAISKNEYAVFLENEVLPRWQELHADFAAAQNVPPVYQPVIADYTKAFELFQTSVELKIEGIRENDPRKMTRSDQTFHEANAILQRMQDEAEANQVGDEVG